MHLKWLTKRPQTQATLFSPGEVPPNRLTQLLEVDADHAFLAAVEAQGDLPALARTSQQVRQCCMDYRLNPLYPAFERAAKRFMLSPERPARAAEVSDAADALASEDAKIMAAGLRGLLKMRVAIGQKSPFWASYRAIDPKEVRADMALLAGIWTDFVERGVRPVEEQGLSERLDKLQLQLFGSFADPVMAEWRNGRSVFPIFRLLWGVHVLSDTLKAISKDATTLRMYGSLIDWADDEDELVYRALQLSPRVTELLLEESVPPRILSVVQPLAHISTLHIDAPWDEPQPLDALPQLRVLRWYSVTGETLPFTLQTPSNLEVLVLEGTHGPFPAQLPQLRLMPKLRSLVINQTNLSTFPDEILGLSTLERLNLRLNRLTALPAQMSSLPRLRYLNVSANALETMTLGLLQLPELQWVELHNNRLTAWPPELNVLIDVKALGFGKRLTRRYPAMMAGLRGSKIGDFKGNPCDWTLMPKTRFSRIAIICMVYGSVKLREKRHSK